MTRSCRRSEREPVPKVPPADTAMLEIEIEGEKETGVEIEAGIEIENGAEVESGVEIEAGVEVETVEVGRCEVSQSVGRSVGRSGSR